MNKGNKHTLYRIRKKGKIAGVCAGIADYLGFEVWLVRVVTASIFLLGGSGIVFIIYILLWVVLDIKPENVQQHQAQPDIEIKEKFWQAGASATIALQDVKGKICDVETKLQNIERYVTSDSFELSQKINNL